MKLLIIQSLGVNSQLSRLIDVEYPTLFDEILETDSFDHALSILPEHPTEVKVFSCWMFHDSHSKQRGKVPETIPDEKKNGDMLARMMKEKNPNVRFYVYSSLAPQTTHVDGHIVKGEKFKEDVEKIFEIINKF